MVDRTGAQLQRIAKFLQTKQPFFQQLQPEVVRDVSAWYPAFHAFLVAAIFVSGRHKVNPWHDVLLGV